ncbi:UNVERIFIED_CONTAM: hypothetical protein Scaly_0103900 [Sesamum calycinum]|uniref:Wall-associated receptor kinase C-terminal domain-containing protein n=1 Tax=Sesamum calycinum TaxID=2727403 RepID=A0AAW2SWQ1_9LAMI
MFILHDKGQPDLRPVFGLSLPIYLHLPRRGILGLPLFPPTNSCCVYSPANLDPNVELDIRELKCGGYTSVVSLGDLPTEPGQWLYGVALKYTLGGLDSYNIAPSCRACEMSGGVCGKFAAGNFGNFCFLHSNLTE